MGDQDGGQGSNALMWLPTCSDPEGGRDNERSKLQVVCLSRTDSMGGYAEDDMMYLHQVIYSMLYIM
eukprot:scaffold32227_cov47-Prasinocladus_malaysianus.AAC.2